MGKAGKWLRNFFTGKKAKEKGRRDHSNPDRPTENRFSSVPVAATKEKRWSFRRSAGATKDSNSSDASLSEPRHGPLVSEIDQRRHAVAVAVATAAVAEAAVVAAQAAAAVVRLTATANDRTTRAIEAASALKIQSFFRSYLARKALNALKGLVKMQALVRGHLVRKQANATLRCMQALVKAQGRARAGRIRMAESSHSTTPLHRFEMDGNEEEYVKIVEMDLGGIRSHSLGETQRTHNSLAEMSPGVYSGNYEEFSFATAQNSPQLSAMSMPAAHASFDYPLCPNYMANTESFRAKLRSQSAPKQRLDACERQSSKRNIPRGVRMQRSSSLVGLAGNSYEYPWSIKLHKSNDMSLIESECGSTSTVLTNKNYCRSLAGYEIHGND